MNSSPAGLCHILLIEGSPLDAELAEERLRTSGIPFDFATVDNRQGFLDAFEHNHYDLILADYTLPDFDGLSALEIVRARYKRLPFIFVSGVPGEDVAVETMLRGATDYILKQKLDRLIPAVKRALAEHADYLRRERAERELKEREDEARLASRRQQLLLSVLQQQRTTDNADALTLAATRMLGDYLHATQGAFLEVLPGDRARYLGAWNSTGKSREGELDLTPIGDGVLENYRRGEPMVVSNYAVDARVNRDRLRSLGITAYVSVPILRFGQWRAAFYLANEQPRNWMPEEVSFIREVAEITWDSVERTRAVTALAQSEQQLRTAAETANLGSWDLNLQTRHLVCSAQCKLNFGWPQDQCFTYEDLRNCIHPEDRAAMDAAMDEAIRNRTTWRTEYRTVWPDGSLHWAVAAGRASYDDEGNAARMIAFSLDVTERHLAEAALLESEKLAAVGRLASSIAHEINNPLESVTNLLYLASHSETLKEVKTYVSSAEQELSRVSAITNQTLRFHRQSTSPRSVTSEELFESVLSVYQARLINSKVNVSTRLRAKRTVTCLDGEIRQVLNNLVGNAIDAMQTGGCLALRSREARDRDGHAGVLLTVADSGSGITAAVREKLYNAFFTTKGMAGTGLGLWISKQIVDRHAGRLRLYSSVNPRHHGTVFSLFLPCESRLKG